MKVYGLTGSIATGKSTVTQFLLDLGYKVICADQIAHALTSKGEPALNAITKEFGSKYITATGELDRTQLAALVFNDETARTKLNTIIHPLVENKIKQEITEYIKQGCPLVFLDIPLLYEARLETLCDKVLVVYATEAQQIERLMKRNKLTRDEATLRIKSQMSIEDKRKRADCVIDNSGIMDALKIQVAELLKKL